MSYGRMANVYDQLMAHAPYEQWVQFAKDHFNFHSQPVRRVIDLGCGTGEITTDLARNGYALTGVDYSAEMLAIAAQKARDKQLSIQWIQQDIRELEGISRFDAAISFCDVINYITKPEDVQRSFNRIADYLEPGGLFLFDVHHLPHIVEHYIDETFAEVTDEASYIWFCTAGEELGEMYHDLTFFYLDGNRYGRFDEQHHQRTFSIKFYKKLLIEAGFENIKTSADFAEMEEVIPETAARIFFSATKKTR